MYYIKSKTYLYSKACINNYNKRPIFMNSPSTLPLYAGVLQGNEKTGTVDS